MPEDDWENITSVEQLDFAKADISEEVPHNKDPDLAVAKPTAGEEDDWLSEEVKDVEAGNSGSKSASDGADLEEDQGGDPMFIINLTLLSEGKIHSKFDRHSVNDSEAATKLRKEVAAKFEEYSSKKDLIESGVVKPCSTSVWKAALSALRDEYTGHYFAPIFPPTQR